MRLVYFWLRRITILETRKNFTGMGKRISKETLQVLRLILGVIVDGLISWISNKVRRKKALEESTKKSKDEEE